MDSIGLIRGKRMLDLQKKTLEVKFDGNVYKMTFPTVSQIEKMQKKTKEEGESLDSVFSLLEEVGLPKEIVKQMQIDHVNAIVEHLTDAKKN